MREHVGAYHVKIVTDIPADVLQECEAPHGL